VGEPMTSPVWLSARRLIYRYLSVPKHAVRLNLESVAAAPVESFPMSQDVSLEIVLPDDCEEAEIHAVCLWYVIRMPSHGEAETMSWGTEGGRTGTDSVCGPDVVIDTGPGEALPSLHEHILVRQ